MNQCELTFGAFFVIFVKKLCPSIKLMCRCNKHMWRRIEKRLVRVSFRFWRKTLLKEKGLEIIIFNNEFNDENQIIESLDFEKLL